MMFDDLKGKKALITGASGGLGLHFAELLARRGALVTLSARRKQALDEACARIEAAGGSARTVQMDVSDSASVVAALAEVGTSFDILVNNAGISGAARALDLKEAEWDRVLDTNLKGVFVVAQAVARGMKAAGHGGTIVNIASILGTASPANLSAYATSKAGVIQLTRRWRWSGRVTASASTRCAPAISRQTSIASSSPPRRATSLSGASRSAGWASPRNSTALCSCSLPRPAAISPVRRSRSTVVISFPRCEVRHEF